MFDARRVLNQKIDWLRDYMQENAKPETKIVVAISGGKDSSIVAAICACALGPERVLGVLLPQGQQDDTEFSHDLCKHLDIPNVTLNIGDTMRELYGTVLSTIQLRGDMKILRVHL